MITCFLYHLLKHNFIVPVEQDQIHNKNNGTNKNMEQKTWNKEPNKAGCLSKNGQTTHLHPGEV